MSGLARVFSLFLFLSLSLSLSLFISCPPPPPYPYVLSIVSFHISIIAALTPTLLCVNNRMYALICLLPRHRRVHLRRRFEKSVSLSLIYVAVSVLLTIINMITSTTINVIVVINMFTVIINIIIIVIIVVYHLRTGHCGLSVFLKRIGISDTSLCECEQADQTPDHILQSCPKYAERRQLTWPHGADLATKLWGSAEDLYRTAGFVAST